jgi:hypothetical protein
MALSIAAFTSSGTSPCRLLNEQVRQPTRSIASLLATRPDVAWLSDTGCRSILTAVRELPAGARLARELGARGIENAQSRCTTSVNSIRYLCGGSEDGYTRCLPESYSYCGQWEYSATAQPRYELGMELAASIDAAYDKAQQLCGLAMSWDTPGAQSAARELESYLEERVLPGMDRLDELSCND